MTRLGAGFALSILAAPALAEEGGPSCETTARSAVIQVLVCDASGTDAELRDIGLAACGAVLPCGAWFWTHAEDAPEVAPENHDGLTQAQVTSSLGVFVAERDIVVRIDQVTE